MFLAKLLVALALVPALPLQAQPTADLFLQTAILRARDTAKRVPGYLCGATIDHTEVVAPRLAGTCGDPSMVPFVPNWSDRLHVDFFVAEGSESYSWNGEAQFQNRDVFEAVRSRRSSGGMSGFLESIFGDERTRFTYSGEVHNGALRFKEYTFQVPESRSSFWFDRNEKQVILAYQGTAQFDAGTADLVRIRVHASESADITGACRATATVDYVRAPLQGSEFFLPTHVQTETRDTMGRSFSNEANLTNCHAFPGDAAQAAAAPTPLQLAPKSNFVIAFTQDIDYTKAAAGDIIEASLVTPLLDSSKHVVAPAGTRVIGRILQLSWMHNTPRPFTGPMRIGVQTNFQLGASVMYQLESLVIDGVAHPFASTPGQKIDSPDPMDAMTVRMLSNPPPGGFPSGTSTATLARPNVALIKVKDPKGNLIVKAGRPAKWKTAPK